MLQPPGSFADPDTALDVQFTDNVTVTSVAYLVLNVILAVTASSLVVIFAPQAAGSGIPELMTYFNNADIPSGFLSLKTFVVKVVT